MNGRSISSPQRMLVLASGHPGHCVPHHALEECNTDQERVSNIVMAPLCNPKIVVLIFAQVITVDRQFVRQMKFWLKAATT